MASLKGKLVFLDSNIFIGCALEDIDDSSVKIIRDIAKQIDDNRMTLLLPAVIKAETNQIFTEGIGLLKESFEKMVKDYDKNGKRQNQSKLLTRTLDVSRKFYLSEIAKEERGIKKELKKILRKSILIKLDDEIILKALNRASLKQPPYGEKNSYLLHIDCIAVESLLKFLKINVDAKNHELIFCSNDPDYYNKTKKPTLKPLIYGQLNKHVKKIIVYKNPAKMLQSEFDEKYKKEQVQRYEKGDTTKIDFSTYNSLPNQINNIGPTLGTLSTSAISSLPPLFSANLQDNTTLKNVNEPFNTLITRTCPACGYSFQKVPDSASVGSLTLSNMTQCPMCGNIF